MPVIDAKGEVIAATAPDAPVVLKPGDSLAGRVEELLALPLIAVEFPKFRDGRGFTLARELRERHGYAGDIRAVGHFIPDQFAALIACGFTSFVTPQEHEPEQYAHALAAHRQPGQLLRRSVARALEV